MKIKLNSIYVHDQDKALKIYTEQLLIYILTTPKSDTGRED